MVQSASTFTQIMSLNKANLRQSLLFVSASVMLSLLLFSSPREAGNASLKIARSVSSPRIRPYGQDMQLVIWKQGKGKHLVD